MRRYFGTKVREVRFLPPKHLNILLACPTFARNLPSSDVDALSTSLPTLPISLPSPDICPLSASLLLPDAPALSTTRDTFRTTYPLVYSTLPGLRKVHQVLMFIVPYSDICAPSTTHDTFHMMYYWLQAEGGQRLTIMLLRVDMMLAFLRSGENGSIYAS